MGGTLGGAIPENFTSDLMEIDYVRIYEESSTAGGDATLSDLKVDGTSLTGFSSSTTSYTYNVVEGTTDIPDITAATTTDSNAQAVITQASSIPGDATVLVTAQDGETTKTYTVSFAYVSSPKGTWKLTPAAGSLMVGPTQGDGSWWTNSEADATSTRACLFDDEYVFNTDGSFENKLGGQTWLETWQGVSEGCGTPIAPHDGSNAATWSYDATAATITISGEGAFLGLSKAHNTGEDGAPVNNTIEYIVTAISSTGMTIDINVGTGWWRFLFTKQAAAPSEGPSSPPSRDETDVISVYSDAYSSLTSVDIDPNWNQTTDATEIQVGSDNILKYSGLNYQGMDYTTSDVSSMDYVHLDYWTDDSTDFGFYVIKAGGSEYEYSIDGELGITTGEWVSINIPLSLYSNGGVDLTAVDQFKTVGNGTIYLDNIYFWKDEPTWTGNTDSDWSEAGNWDPALVPTSLADLTIPSDATITASENITVNSMSVASGASIISTGTITGDITYTRSISTSNWYLISSPVSGQDIDAFVSASDLATGAGNNVAFANYNNSTAAWSYYQSGASGTGDFTLGQGHAIKLDAQGSVSFTGNFNASNQEISLTTNTNGFNLIGNSYLASVSVGELLAANNSGELAEQTIWLWNQASDAYVEKNLAADLEIAPGQGFFVKASGSATFDITESMQSHSSDAFQRPSTRPEIDLTMTDGTDTRGADIFYIEGTTTGFDNGYDSSIFEGAANEFAIYTHAVANGNGRNLGIQSLPPNNYENMIIPVGINAVSGTDITIDASTVNFPVGMNVYLEDKDDNSFTLLDSDSNFTTTLASDLNGIGRFYLHTTTGTLGAENLEIDNLSIYISSRENLRIVGVQNGTARVQLYNILGKEVLRSTFEGTGVNDIQLPSLAEGIYIVHLSTANGTTNKKIIIE